MYGFKGWFHCGDGSRCDPLTLTDGYSRFLLRCQGMQSTDEPGVRGVMEAAFREFDTGEPLCLRALQIRRKALARVLL